MSKTIQKFCEENPEMIGDLGWWYEGVDGYWVDLASGYEWCGCSSVHEFTVKDVLHALRHEVRKVNSNG